MPEKQLRDYLDTQGIKYVSILHSPAYTAQEIAESAHISGKTLAKTIIVDIDGKMSMAVMPANHVIDLPAFEAAYGLREGTARIASEDEFVARFPSCEIGAMPPFGNLYDMDVYVDSSLVVVDEIAFNAGTHAELIQLAVSDFIRLVGPKASSFAPVQH